MSGVNRMSGMVSGMDTESQVQKLMEAEKLRVSAVERRRTWVEWQQTAYRDMIRDITSFQQKRLDLTKPATNMRSPSSFAKFSSSATLNGLPATAVSVKGVSQMNSSSTTIQSIDQLAAVDRWESKHKEAFVGDADLNVGDINGATGQTFSITIDGVTRELTLSGDYTSQEDIAEDLQAQIYQNFGTPPAGLEASATRVTVEEGKINITAGGGQAIKLSEGSGALSQLGLTDGDKNFVETRRTLGEEFGISGEQTFSINGVEFAADENTTIQNLMNQVNNSDAGVRLSYDTLNHGFVLTATETGFENSINVEDSSGFLAGSLNLTGSSTGGGKDAIFTMNGVLTSRSTNSFVIDGAEYTLNHLHDGSASAPIQVSFTTDVDAIVDNITQFINDYNELLKSLNEASSERRNFRYQPLTDDERKAMSEDEIELWEEQAKRGLLSGDPAMRSMTTQMRQQMMQPVAGSSFTLADMGITPSTNYMDGGTLVIDEEKLRQAIANDYDEVVNLFTASSSTPYTDTANRSSRTPELGIAGRLNDILQDNVRTTRDSRGNKGIFLQRAGIENDSSDNNNMLSKQLDDYNKRIDRLMEQLAARENYYYNMFAAMEKAMAQMDQQAGALMQFMA